MVDFIDNNNRCMQQLVRLVAVIGYRRTVKLQQEHATDRPSLGSARPGGAKLTYLFPPTHNTQLALHRACLARLAGWLAGWLCRKVQTCSCNHIFLPCYRTYCTVSFTCAYSPMRPRNRGNLAIRISFSPSAQGPPSSITS